MLIIGSRGFAKQLLHSLPDNEWPNLHFFDNINTDTDYLFHRFPILHTSQEVKKHFDTEDPRFTLGIGNPKLREKLSSDLINLGGKFTTTVSQHANVSIFDVSIKEGVNILSGVTVEPSVTIGTGCLININVTITHDVKIGSFVEIAPNVNLLGACEIGDGSFLGTGAIILPKIKIGKNAVIGAGAVVVKDVSDNQKVLGIPAK